MDSIIINLIIGFAIGNIFMYLDKKYLHRVYHRWYNLTNRVKISENVNVGFVINQLFKQKLIVVIFLGIIFYLTSLIFGGNLLKDLFYTIFMCIGIIISFYSSGLIFNKLGHILKNKIIKMEESDKNNFFVNISKTNKQGTIANENQDKESDNINIISDLKNNKTVDNNSKNEKNIDENHSNDINSNENWRDGVDKFLKK